MAIDQAKACHHVAKAAHGRRVQALEAERVKTLALEQRQQQYEAQIPKQQRAATGDTFDQSLAKGFIELWALPSKISAKREQKHS